MKAILVILLIALASSEFPEDLIKIGKCLLESDAVRALIPKVLEAVRTGDFLSLLPTLLESLPELKTEVMECLNGEPILKAQIPDFQCETCESDCPPVFGRKECLRLCNKYCAWG